MAPVCFSGDNGPARLHLERAQWRMSHPNRSLAQAPPDRECLRATAVGPYPFARGPLHAYSQPTARAMVRLVAPNESYVLRRLGKLTLTHPQTGVRVAPGEPSHPARKLLVEDALYGYLQLVGLEAEALTMIDATMCEMAGVHSDRQRRFEAPQMCGGWSRAGSARMQADLKLPGFRGRPRGLYAADIYHGAKQSERVDYLLRRPHVLRVPENRTLECDGGALGRLMHGMQGCCRGWRMCRFVDPQELRYQDPAPLYPAPDLYRSFQRAPRWLRRSRTLRWPYEPWQFSARPANVSG